jgi:hypothetical protein
MLLHKHSENPDESFMNFQRRNDEMIVVIMAEQHEINMRKIIKTNSQAHSLWTTTEWTCALRPNQSVRMFKPSA